MTLKIPSSLRGIDGKKAYEKIVNEITETKPETPTRKPTGPSVDGFIQLPSGIYVSKTRLHCGENWFDSHKLLQAENKLMLTIPQFIEFLKYLKSQGDNESLRIYNDITEVKSPYRANWLDADFKVKANKLYIKSKHLVDASGNLIPQSSEVLDRDTLMNDKNPGISLEKWLSSPTSQGLPKKDCDDGDLYYWNPRSDNNSVARFGASSDWASLICGGYPSYSVSGLGVFALVNNVS